MNLCAISFKDCWQDESGRWLSDGGFPVQMRGIASLFDRMTLVITRGVPRRGGIPLPEAARIVPIHKPCGADFRRKISVATGLPRYLSTLVREVRGADVVHVPLPGDIPFLGMLVALGARKRLLARYGGSWESNATTTRMNLITRAVMRRAAGGRNVMLATGEGDDPPAPGIHWIFSTALSADELARISTDLDRTPPAPPRLIYAGRLSPEKGVDVLIRAIAVLRARTSGPKPRLVLAGDGPERETLTGLVRGLRCDDAIEFAGQLDRTALSDRMARSDLCVQPSRTEGFSKAWLDALAHGLPVVASEVGAARAVIGRDGERGWLVPPGDERILADTLARALSGPVDWPSLRRRCRNYADGRTLESWSGRIGDICEQQWGLALKLGGNRS